MEKKTRLKLKTVSSFLTCLLSLFSIVALTLSWFAINGNADTDGMDVVIKSGDIVSDCEYFVADENDLANYAFIPADSAGKNTLGTYDVLNDKYQFLIKVNLKAEATVNVTAETATDYFLGAADAEEKGHLLKRDGSGNALSSVISFAVLGANEPQKTANGYKLTALPQDTSCFFDRSALVSATAPERSVTIGGGLTVSKDADGNAYFFVLLSYDPLLASTVFAANIGNEVLETAEDDKIPFELDFGIVVSVVR